MFSLLGLLLLFLLYSPNIASLSLNISPGLIFINCGRVYSFCGFDPDKRKLEEKGEERVVGRVGAQNKLSMSPLEGK
jgi:hypothetical protein